MANRGPRWQIDKRIPVAVILVVLTQTVTFAYYSGRLVGKIETLESTTEHHTSAIEALQGANLEIQKTLIKIEDKLEVVTSRNKKANLSKAIYAYQ